MILALASLMLFGCDTAPSRSQRRAPQPWYDGRDASAKFTDSLERCVKNAKLDTFKRTSKEASRLFDELQVLRKKR